MSNKKATVLSEIKPGTRARILKVAGNGETSRRIADMGMTAGSIVEVKRVAPLGDPMEVRIRGYYLSLRLAEASRIAVVPI